MQGVPCRRNSGARGRCAAAATAEIRISRCCPKPYAAEHASTAPRARRCTKSAQKARRNGKSHARARKMLLRKLDTCNAMFGSARRGSRMGRARCANVRLNSPMAAENPSKQA
eukprot:4239115-Pleurochrysis_carterae.AAC.1